MASMKDIKRRKESVQSTGQITRAMKLVSTVKLQKARGKAENAKPYFDAVYGTVAEMLRKSDNINHRYLKESEGGKKGIIVISSNRGLAGGYNSNISKLITGKGFDPSECVLYSVGGKSRDFLARKGYETADDYSEVIEEPTYTDAMKIGAKVLKDFEDGKISEIYLAYTFFKNTVSHIPTFVKLLPVKAEDIQTEETEETEDKAIMNYEPEADEALDIIIPKYVNSMIYGALIEAVASENGARMTAMDNATNNAEEIVTDLSLKYNRARQGAITQELTEIIAGANAIS